MPLRSDRFDLGALRLTAGEGRRRILHTQLEPFMLGGERYDVAGDLQKVLLDISRTTGQGFALRLRFDAALQGPCMRCLADAGPTFVAEAREVWQPGEADDLDSPYVEDGVLDLGRWARDALALALPASILCRADCAGLCAVCGADLNLAGPDHMHERARDPRWAKLSELRFD